MTYHPPGWRAGQIERRFADTQPQTYDAESHSVIAVLSRGAPVSRLFGTEELKIDPSAVDLDRVHQGCCPLLDSHQSSGIASTLGRIDHAWFERGALMGKIVFAGTAEGQRAEEMIRRREIRSVSIGYAVDQWEIRDSDGDVVDPQEVRISFDDDTRLTFVATKWRLYEASLTSIPADSGALIRSFGSGVDRVATDAKVRMLARHRISVRQNMFDEQSALGGHDD